MESVIREGNCEKVIFSEFTSTSVRYKIQKFYTEIL